MFMACSCGIIMSMPLLKEYVRNFSGERQCNFQTFRVYEAVEDVKVKISFLFILRKISTLSVLPTLDWAIQMSKQENIVIVSGFHSRLEKDVLKILLQGKCGIIVVLARGMYRKVPQLYEEAMNTNRILFISYEKDIITRVSEASAHKRNRHVMNLSDEVEKL